MSSTPMTKPQQPDGALADNLTHTTLQHGPSSSPGRQIGAAQARAGAVPQTAVTPAVTRRYSSGLLNFAAHSPEGGQRDRKSHSARLWRTDRTDCSSTERRFLGGASAWVCPSSVLPLAAPRPGPPPHGPQRARGRGCAWSWGGGGKPRAALAGLP